LVWVACIGPPSARFRAAARHELERWFRARSRYNGVAGPASETELDLKNAAPGTADGHRDIAHMGRVADNGSGGVGFSHEDHNVTTACP
jgi:hypothetical protein